MIYERGCLRAGEEWVERNLVPVAGVGVAVSVLQVPDTCRDTCTTQLEGLLIKSQHLDVFEF